MINQDANNMGYKDFLVEYLIHLDHYYYTCNFIQIKHKKSPSSFCELDELFEDGYFGVLYFRAYFPAWSKTSNSAMLAQASLVVVPLKESFKATNLTSGVGFFAFVTLFAVVTFKVFHCVVLPSS